MAKPKFLEKALEDTIKKNDYTIAKYKFILCHFPDAMINNDWYPDFSSASVNAQYTKYEFEHAWRSVNVIPYCELDFIYEGQLEIIKIHSKPKRKRLAYKSFKRINDKPVIKFCRIALNLKNNNFKDDMLNDCRTEIMKFIQKHPNHHLDTKYLEPRLKKLLLFT